MAEYIEREAAKLCVKEHYDDAIIIALNKLPAADVAPVRHGRWTSDRMSFIDADGVSRRGIWGFKCSKCGGFCIGEANYCPNCGARMDGEE